MNKLLLILFTLCCFSTVQAQLNEGEKNQLHGQTSDTLLGWKVKGIATITSSQSSFSNWAAGGINSFSATGLVNIYAGYTTKAANWSNTLDLGYGILKQGKNAPWIKTDDKIEFTSIYGRKITQKFYYAGLANFKTQFEPGYNYKGDSSKISNFMAPGYVLVAIGIEYKPNENFTALLAPIASRTIIVIDQSLADQGAFGVTGATYDGKGNIITRGKKVKEEFGGYFKLMFRKDNLFKNVNFLTKADLFSNYLHNPQNLVVNWETLITLKVNKVLSATISTDLIYDDAVRISDGKNSDGTKHYIGPRTQFKEVIGLGLSYNFSWKN